MKLKLAVSRAAKVVRETLSTGSFYQIKRRCTAQVHIIRMIFNYE